MRELIERHPKVALCGRIVIPIPCIVYSIYIVVITSNQYWTKFAGNVLLILSLFFMIFSVLLLLFGVLSVISKVESQKKIHKIIFLCLCGLELIWIAIIMYYTSLKRELENSFWVSSYLTNNVNETIVVNFLARHVNDNDIAAFVRERTLKIHDVLFFVTVIWLVLLVVFVIIPDFKIQVNVQRFKILIELLKGSEDDESPLLAGRQEEDDVNLEVPEEKEDAKRAAKKSAPARKTLDSGAKKSSGAVSENSESNTQARGVPPIKSQPKSIDSEPEKEASSEPRNEDKEVSSEPKKETASEKSEPPMSRSDDLLQLSTGSQKSRSSGKQAVSSAEKHSDHENEAVGASEPSKHEDQKLNSESSSHAQNVPQQRKKKPSTTLSFSDSEEGHERQTKKASDGVVDSDGFMSNGSHSAKSGKEQSDKGSKKSNRSGENSGLERKATDGSDSSSKPRVVEAVKRPGTARRQRKGASSDESSVKDDSERDQSGNGKAEESGKQKSEGEQAEPEKEVVFQEPGTNQDEEIISDDGQNKRDDDNGQEPPKPALKRKPQKSVDDWDAPEEPAQPVADWDDSPPKRVVPKKKPLSKAPMKTPQKSVDDWDAPEEPAQPVADWDDSPPKRTVPKKKAPVKAAQKSVDDWDTQEVAPSTTIDWDDSPARTAPKRQAPTQRTTSAWDNPKTTQPTTNRAAARVPKSQFDTPPSSLIEFSLGSDLDVGPAPTQPPKSPDEGLDSALNSLLGNLA